MMKQGLFRGLTATVVATILLAAHGSSVEAQPVASITLPEPGGTVQLYPWCNNISLTFDNGTPSETVAQAVTPAESVQAMWRHNAALNTFEGFSPAAPPEANDLLTVNFLDSVWLCLATAPAPAATPTPSPPPPPAPPALTATPAGSIQPAVWSDGRIGITVDKVQRVDVIPADIIESLPSYPPPGPPPAAAGHDYVCVYLAVAHIENVHVVGALGHGDEEPTLRDAEGHRYDLVLGRVTGVRFLDPHHLTGPSEVVEGATVVLVFEIAEDQKPALLTFVYSFKENWEEVSPKRGQVDISL